MGASDGLANCHACAGCKTGYNVDVFNGRYCLLVKPRTHISTLVFSTNCQLVLRLKTGMRKPRSSQTIARSRSPRYFDYCEIIKVNGFRVPQGVKQHDGVASTDSGGLGSPDCGIGAPASFIRWGTRLALELKGIITKLDII